MIVSRLFILFLITCFPNIMILKQNNSNVDNNLWINKSFNIKVYSPILKYSGFNYLSPIFIGALGGGLILIILIATIYCCCKNSNNDQVETTPKLKVELFKSLDLSLEKSKGLSSSQITKDINELNNKDQSEDISDRKLVGTNVQNPNEKITTLFKNLSGILNNQYHSEHDKNEFFKPMKKPLQDAVSDISIVSRLTPDQILMRNKESVLICYTNEKRDSPPESFYEKKLEDLKEEESEIRNKYKDNDAEMESDDNKEDISKDDKRNLRPGETDIISDYKEKTKNFKFKVFKQDTSDFEKESLERFNNKLSFRKSQDDSGISFDIKNKMK